MNGQHWTDDELLDTVYGLGPQNGHVGDCSECDVRLKALMARRSEVRHSYENELNSGAVRFARQRRSVMERIERSNLSIGIVKPSLALCGALAMVFVLVLYHPQSTKLQEVQTASSDSQFFSEIYADVEQAEPRAAKPMRRLFEVSK